MSLRQALKSSLDKAVDGYATITSTPSVGSWLNTTAIACTGGTMLSIQYDELAGAAAFAIALAFRVTQRFRELSRQELGLEPKEGSISRFLDSPTNAGNIMVAAAGLNVVTAGAKIFSPELAPALDATNEGLQTLFTNDAGRLHNVLVTSAFTFALCGDLAFRANDDTNSDVGQSSGFVSTFFRAAGNAIPKPVMAVAQNPYTWFGMMPGTFALARLSEPGGVPDTLLKATLDYGTIGIAAGVTALTIRQALRYASGSISREQVIDPGVNAIGGSGNLALSASAAASAEPLLSAAQLVLSLTAPSSLAESRIAARRREQENVAPSV